MLQLKTFKTGGIHPPHEKLSAASPVVYGEVPEQLLITVDQHIGKPLKVLVKKGDAVSRGDLLAQSTGFVSSNVHCPVNGKVLKIVRFPQLGGQIRQSILLIPENPGQNYKEVIDADPAVEVDFNKLTADDIQKKLLMPESLEWEGPVFQLM